VRNTGKFSDLSVCERVKGQGNEKENTFGAMKKETRKEHEII
jgi:hypothetical protein